MALKANLIASYANQIYSSLIGILILPFYIDYMGAEAYGLVGFFTMLTAWFTLLDMGLTPTIMRESARFHGGAASTNEYLLLVRSFAALFLIIAVGIFIAVWMSSNLIAENWLNIERLSTGEVALCISIMGAIIALRWFGGLLRGVINGAEKIVLLSVLNSSFSTLRFVVVLPIIMFVNAEPLTYFGFQLAVALLEFAALCFFALSILPKQKDRFALTHVSLNPIKKSLAFSLSIAFTSMVWVLVTQTDKLVLSKLMTLSEYGYYSLAVLAASGVLILSSPIASVIMPRLANLEARRDQVGFLNLYRTATQFASIASASLAFILFFFSSDLLWVWTGNQDVVTNASDILSIYALGNGVLVVAAFPYYMQFAKGDMKMHVYGNMLFVAVLLPLVIWAASIYGAIGAAWVWFASNLVLFLFWLPWVHKRFFDALNRLWFTKDTVFIFIMVGGAVCALSSIDFQSKDRLVLLIYLMFAGGTSLLVGVLSASKARSILSAWLKVKGDVHAK